MLTAHMPDHGTGAALAGMHCHRVAQSPDQIGTPRLYLPDFAGTTMRCSFVLASSLSEFSAGDIYVVVDLDFAAGAPISDSRFRISREDVGRNPDSRWSLPVGSRSLKRSPDDFHGDRIVAGMMAGVGRAIYIAIAAIHRGAGSQSRTAKRRRRRIIWQLSCRPGTS
jgi:hypothetical protein